MYLLYLGNGSIAQLGERLVRNEEVGGPNPLRSTKTNHNVVGQTHLSGFAQNDLSSIDEASV